MEILSELLLFPIMTSLCNVLVTEGEDAIFEVTASGKPEPKVEWFLDSLPLLPSESIITKNTGKAHQLILHQCNHSQSGIIQVKATNKVGNVMSKAHLMVRGKV